MPTPKQLAAIAAALSQYLAVERVELVPEQAMDRWRRAGRIESVGRIHAVSVRSDLADLRF